jgi:hypothetical protein
MRTQKASPFFAPSHLICPDCSIPMRLASILPSTTSRNTDEILYCCEECSSGIKLVTGPLDGISRTI